MRRGLLIALLAALLPSPASSEGIIDWWLTPDQQGRLAFERGDYQRAARSFDQPLWKAIAFYKAGDFATAADLFRTIETPEGLFYLGNAYARQERLAPAIAAYEQALRLKPEFPEARFNLDWVTGLHALDQKTYDDAGGTGGKLAADRMVLDERGARGQGTMTSEEAKAQTGLSDAELRDMWMRRVQTTPGDFLALKFAADLQARGRETPEAKKGGPQ